MGLGEGARRSLSVFLHQRAACAPQPGLAGPWLRPGGAGLQHRAAALPKARRGDGTGRQSLSCSVRAAEARGCGDGAVGAEGAVLTWAGQVFPAWGGFCREKCLVLWESGSGWRLCGFQNCLSALFPSRPLPRLRDAVPSLWSLPGTRWDTLVIALCARGMWHSWRAEGSVSLCSS